MKTYEYMEQLEQLFQESFKVPLSNGKILVDSIFMQEILSDMRDALPEEFEQAVSIVRDKNNILSDARREADVVMKNAEEKAKFLVSRDEITRGAEEKAAAMIAEAKKDAEALEKAANARANECINSAKIQAEEIMRQTQDAAQQLRLQADEYSTTTINNANARAAEIKQNIEGAAANLAGATNEYSEQILTRMYELMVNTAKEIKDVHGQIRNDFTIK